jgi:hypothetical protein
MEEKALAKNEKELKNGEVRSEVLNDVKSEQVLSEELKKPDKKVEPVRDKTKPISSTPVSGTPWYVIHTIFVTFDILNVFPLTIGALCGRVTTESFSTIQALEPLSGNALKIFKTVRMWKS